MVENQRLDSFSKLLPACTGLINKVSHQPADCLVVGTRFRISDWLVTMSRVAVHYTVGGLLLGVYGTHVCPFIDSLSFTGVALPILVTFSSQLLLRILPISLQPTSDIRTLVTKQFKTDLGLFIVGGICLASFNFLVYSFPVGSAIKVIFGMSVLGFFIACDLALRREHLLATELCASGHQIIIDQSPYPLTRKFSWFASICVLVLGATIFVVFAKDLSWLAEHQTTDLKHSAMLVLFEIIFILGVAISYIVLIITAYGSNLQLFFKAQKLTLDQVAEGELAARVPVASNDEFGMIALRTNHTIEALQARTHELQKAQEATILALASLAETRDNETGAHILRTQHYVKALADHLKSHPRFESVLTEPMIDLIYKSAPLHDAGKVGIPDAILLKPGPLTDKEFEEMKKHPMIGSQALLSAQETLGSSSFLFVAREIMETHHEKWDGSGYPNGLKEEEIPISGRLMALADVYDALTSKRVYKAAFSHEKARDIIVEGKGQHFDPDVVEAFLQLEVAFRDIALTFSTPILATRPAA